MSVCCECCVFSGRGLRGELITRPEESYRLWCVVCDPETSRMRRPWPSGSSRAPKKQSIHIITLMSKILRGQLYKYRTSQTIICYLLRLLFLGVCDI